MLSLYLSALDTQEEKDLFEQIYHEYKNKMYAVAYKILHNQMDAEDVVYDSFEAIIKNIEKIDKNNCHKRWGYIVTIVKNNAISLYHKKHRETKYEEWNSIEEIWSNTTHDKTQQREESQILKEEILKLPDIGRHVIYLYYYHDLPYREIAQELHLTEENARQIARRMRKTLEMRLQDRGIGNEPYNF